MSRLIVVVIAGILVGGCTSDSDPTSAPSASEATSPTVSPPGPIRYQTSACPVADEAFCSTANEVIEALQSADVGRLFALSHEDRLVCAELAVEYFPACETDDVLVGHALSGPDFLVEVVDEDGYRRQLEAITSDIDPSFSDDLGDGGVRVIGVGTCGPDVPGRRTYHLAWTAAVSEGERRPCGSSAASSSPSRTTGGSRFGTSARSRSGSSSSPTRSSSRSARRAALPGRPEQEQLLLSDGGTGRATSGTAEGSASLRRLEPPEGVVHVPCERWLR